MVLLRTLLRYLRLFLEPLSGYLDRLGRVQIVLTGLVLIGISVASRVQAVGSVYKHVPGGTPTIIVTALLLLAVVAGLRLSHLVETTVDEQKPRLKVTYDPTDPSCVQVTAWEGFREVRFRMRLKTLGSQTIDDPRVVIYLEATPFNPTPLQPMHGTLSTLHPSETRYIDVLATYAGVHAPTPEVMVFYDPSVQAPNVIPRAPRWFDIEAMGRNVPPTREQFQLKFDGEGEAVITLR